MADGRRKSARRACKLSASPSSLSKSPPSDAPDASLAMASSDCASSPSPSSSVSQIHVLAVDDSIVDRRRIEQMLKTSRFKVTTADSALGALEILGIVDGKAANPSSSSAPTTAAATAAAAAAAAAAAEASSQQQAIQFNLIITDYCMPHMTGYDLLKRVKGTSSLKEIPVVIMSSDNIETRINSCYEEGAEDFIIKPVKADDVKRLSSHLWPNWGAAAAAAAAAAMSSKKRKRDSQGDLISCS